MKVALYARVSTNEDRKLQDPETQLIPLRKYAEARGFEVVREFKEFKSGMDDDRPKFKEMLRQAELERKPFQVIIVFKTDRLTRKSYTLFEVFKRLKAAGVTLISMEESLDTSSMYSEGMMLMLGIIAGWERENIMQRVRAGVARAKQSGTKSGRPFGRPLRGYEVNVTRRKRVPVEEIARVVREEPRISQVKLAERLGIPRSTLQEYLKKMPKKEGGDSL